MTNDGVWIRITTKLVCDVKFDGRVNSTDQSISPIQLCEYKYSVVDTFLFLLAYTRISDDFKILSQVTIPKLTNTTESGDIESRGIHSGITHKQASKQNNHGPLS